VVVVGGWGGVGGLAGWPSGWRRAALFWLGKLKPNHTI
jgi:hypothetical protein